MINKTSFTYIFSFCVCLLFMTACRDDDDMPTLPTTDPDTHLISVQIASNAESTICLDESILELLNSASITSTMICNNGSAATVEIIDINNECFTLKSAAGFTGSLTDTLCMVHCFANDPEICDTTKVLVEVTQSFASGAFVVNEGPFQTGTGTITYYNPDNGEAQEELFQEVNQRPLGNVVQSMGLTFTHGYIVVNNSNKIEVVDLTDFKSAATIENLALPRYFCQVSNDEAFVTQWGQDGLTGSIAVINLNTQELTNTFSTPGKGPEGMLCLADFVLIAQSGGFGRDSTVAVYSSNSGSFQHEIVVGDIPSGLILDKKGQAWCLAKGYLDWMDPSNNTPGQLSILGDQSVFESIPLPNGADNLIFDEVNNRIYYTANQKIWKIDLEGTALGEIPDPDEFLETTFYRISVHPDNGHVYVSDARDFQSQGEVRIYDANATLLETFDAGIIPSHVYFN